MVGPDFFISIVQIQAETFVAAQFVTKHTQFFKVQDDKAGCTDLTTAKCASLVEWQVREWRNRLEWRGFCWSGFGCRRARDLWCRRSSERFSGLARHLSPSFELGRFEECGLFGIRRRVQHVIKCALASRHSGIDNPGRLGADQRHSDCPSTPSQPVPFSLR